MSRPTMTSPALHPRLLAAAALAAVSIALAAPMASARSGGNTPLALRQPTSPERLWSIVRDTTLADADRTAAAEALLALAPETPGLPALELLSAELSPPSPGALPMLRSLARATDPPARLWPALSRLANERIASASLRAEPLTPAGPAPTPLVLSAVSSFRTPEAARTLIQALDPAAPWSLRASAHESLVRLSGRDDLPPQADAWRGWLEPLQASGPEAWSRELARAQAARADRLVQQRTDAVSRLVQTLRRTAVLTPPEDRSKLIVSLLTDGSDEVRRLGVDLALRELSDTRPLDATVAAETLKLLSHESPSTREAGAMLLAQLNPPEAPRAVAEALEHETDPRAAAALLAASIRWAESAFIAPSLRWLAPGPTSTAPSRAAAAESLWSLLRSGVLNSPADREKTLAILRDFRTAQLPPEGPRLLASLGNDEDRAAIASLLTSDSPSLRLSTALALVPYPEFLNQLLFAASRDRALLEPATRGVIMTRPTIEGFLAVSESAAGSEDARQASCLAIGRVMQASDLLSVVHLLGPSDPLHESLLALLVDRDRILSERFDPRQLSAIAEGSLALARLRLESDQPEAALLALDALPAGAVGAEAPSADIAPLPAPVRDEIARLRAIALLRLNQPERASQLPAPPSAWLDAIEASTARTFAPGLLSAFDARFPATDLSPALAERRARVGERVFTAVPGALSPGAKLPSEP
ncbi:MAG: hypothetical protein SFY95_10725 [Planctomycetota bacterium]|nr:hypothetical protein [Planctomycetota bacterium]